MAYTQGRAQGKWLYIVCEKLLKAYFSSVTAAFTVVTMQQLRKKLDYIHVQPIGTSRTHPNYFLSVVVGQPQLSKQACLQMLEQVVTRWYRNNKICRQF